MKASPARVQSVDMSHHALLGRHQAVPVALWRYAAERLHFVRVGFSVEQTVQGQLRRAVGFGTLLFVPGQVLLTHGVIPINHGGKRRRGLLGRHDSAVEQQESRMLGQRKELLFYWDHKQYMKVSSSATAELINAEWTEHST